MLRSRTCRPMWCRQASLPRRSTCARLLHSVLLALPQNQANRKGVAPTRNHVNRRIMPRRRRPNRFVRGFQIGGFCNLLGVLAAGGCIRFTSDVPPDASQDASNDVAEEITPESGLDSRADARDESIILDASLAEVDGPDAPSDVTIDVAPTCQRFDPSIRLAIASDLVSTLLQDC